MLHDFAIIHRRKPNVFAENAGFPVWATCLRGLAFPHPFHSFEVLPEDEFYKQAEAYRFLLEIICGLHSPIIGETEVFGQFKAFANNWVERDGQCLPLVQRLLNDAKSLRSQYLSHLGHQSYGSWLRKNLQVERIHVLGAGHLVQEVLPYLEKNGEVILHVRSPEKVNFHKNVRAIDRQGFDRGALIVAAPVDSECIRSWLKGQRPAQLFDLRDNSSRDPVSDSAVPLHDIFSQIQKTREQLLPIVDQVKMEIALRSEMVAAQEKVRPQGWDDLCA